MPSSGVHRGLQQPVGPDPGSWRRLGAAQGRGGDAGCRGALPGLQPAQSSPRQPAMEKVGNAVPHPGTGSLLKNSVVASFLSYGI